MMLEGEHMSLNRYWVDCDYETATGTRPGVPDGSFNHLRPTPTYAPRIPARTLTSMSIAIQMCHVPAPSCKTVVIFLFFFIGCAYYQFGTSELVCLVCDFMSTRI